MEAQSVTAGQGWAWFVGGWRLFATNPAMWIMLIILFSVIGILLGLIPIIGSLAFMLLAPVLSGGLLYAASEADHQRTIDIKQLFQGFQDKHRMNGLFALGAISLAGTIVTVFVAVVFLGGSMAAVMMAGSDQAASVSVGAGMLLGLLIILTIQTVLIMLLFFAVPLVMLGGEEPVPAMKSSFSACLRNMLPLLVYSVVALILIFIAAIPFGLGFLVLLPVMVGSIYHAYRDIYNAKQSAEPLITAQS